MGKLRAELPGILRWAVEGCLEWKKQGLGFPQKVNAATAAYRAEMDRIADFITDCCKVGPTEKVRLLEMQEAYKAWCMDIGEEPLDPKLLPKELADRGFIKKRGSLGQTYWHGIGLTVVPAGSVAWMGLAPASATGAPISGA
jgi:putative DNA primase/helicase